MVGCNRTTPRQTEHNTELTIHYAWHPWVGQSVQLVIPIDRGPELCFRVDRDFGNKTKRMDIPAWMFDRTVCGAMTKHQGVPYVCYGTLRSLEDLIRTAFPGISRKRVEQEHLPSTQKGNAHGKNQKAQTASRANESIRPKAKSSKMDRTTKSPSKANKQSAGSDSR